MSVPRSTVEQRKAMPLASGVLDYFPDALLVVAEVSRIGNEQHHPGEPLHWDKSKSSDEADALMRHLLDRGTTDTDGVRHTAKVAWRALALLQRELDAEAKAETDATTWADGLAAMAHIPPTLMAGQPPAWKIVHSTKALTPEEVQSVIATLRNPFLGYGGTGSPGTRSDRENSVTRQTWTPATPAVEDWGSGDGPVYGMDGETWRAYGITPPCTVCGSRPEHALNCPRWP